MPFKIIKGNVRPEPAGKINVRLNKEGIEMNNAIKRRKESQKQHEIVQNRIKRLQEIERRESIKVERIKAQIDKFNVIRKVQSEYLQRRKEDIEKYRQEQDLKKLEVRAFKDNIANNLKLKKEEVLIK